MQMKNNTVSNLELLNELATAFSRLCLQGEKREQEDKWLQRAQSHRVQVLAGLEGDLHLSHHVLPSGDGGARPPPQAFKGILEQQKAEKSHKTGFAASSKQPAVRG